MPYDNKSRSSRKTRDVDAESGKNRVSRRPRREPSPQPDYESDDSMSSEEEELRMPRKDDSRRSAPPQKERKEKRKDVSVQDDTLPALEKKEQGKPDHTTLGLSFALAAALHFEMVPIVWDATSYFVPDLRNIFLVLAAAQNLCADNTHLWYIEPAYFTLLTTVYYSYMCCYQILRSIDAAGKLDRNQKRALTRLSIALKPEECIIMGPLVGYFSALGAINPADPKYSWILPKFPVFAGSAAYPGGSYLVQTNGASRIPSIPSLLKAIHTMIATAFDLVDETLAPFTKAAHDAAATAQWFGMDIRATAADNASFKNAVATLTNSVGWIQPADYIDDSVRPASIVKNRIGRMKLPNPADDYVVDSLLKFLVFNDNDDLRWLSSLAKVAANEAKFFKGSVPLASIEPVTTAGSYVGILRTLKAGTNRAKNTTDVYPPETSYIVTGTHKFAGSSKDEMKLGLASQFFAEYDRSDAARPAAPYGNFGRQATGPIFANDNTVSIPVPEFEISQGGEQLGRYSSLISAMCYDPKGEQ